MKDKSPHTPGPWTYESPDRLGIFEVVAPIENGAWVGICVMSTTDDAAMANARLVASAPDLYEYIKYRAHGGDTNAIALVAKVEGK